MEISVKDIEKVILVNTVTLSHNKPHSINVEFYRCYRCGTGITQIQGRIVAISAGYIPSEDVPTITRCYVCSKDGIETNYTFQTQDTKIGPIKLTLAAADRVSTFHCIFCRSPLVQYTKDEAVILPEFEKIVIPHMLPCVRCKAKYMLMDIVEPVL